MSALHRVLEVGEMFKEWFSQTHRELIYTVRNLQCLGRRVNKYFNVKMVCINAFVHRIHGSHASITEVRLVLNEPVVHPDGFPIVSSL